MSEAAAHDHQKGLIGAPIRRVEDPPLITGAGAYTDDIPAPGALHLAFVRSPYPKARVRSVSTEAALGLPGVVRVLTGADLDLEITTPALLPGMHRPPHPILARDAVYAPGVPVAAVVAETAAQARDAADAVAVAYDPLPSVANAEAALAGDAPLARDELDSNVCYTSHYEAGDVDRAFADADHVARLHIASPRLSAMALEPRSILASPGPRGDTLTVWLSTQAPHRVRADLASTIGFPEQNIRVIAPDVGGGFGSKGPLYREDVLACWLALQLRRPVKWIATRTEDLITTVHGRDQSMTSELALRKDGTITALKVRVVANLGAYLQSSTAGPPRRMMNMALGCYRIPNARVEVVAVFTNTCTTGPYRGAGRPEAVQNIERLVDQAAQDLGLDRLELRRRNFIRPDEFPYRTPLGPEYDSGDYDRALRKAQELAGWPELIRRRDDARARGELVGVGVSTFVEPSGGAGFESGTIRIERTGQVTVLTGSSAHGQGHETVFAQVVAQQLRMPMHHVRVHHGDTLGVQQGTGTFGSRSAIMGGGALATAATRLLEKARQIAAHLLEAATDDVVQADGGFAVVGAAGRTVSWQQVAAAAYTGSLPEGMERGLQETAFFDPRREAWSFGCHIALVQVDRATGQLTIEKLVLVDDSGVVLNPLIVEGQVHGGVAQGLGEALWEEMRFDDTGAVLSGTLMDYAVPRATGMPPLVLGETVTPNPFNPLGVKGVGEAGTNGTPPAVASAVLDALSPLGIGQLNMPYTAPKLWQAIQDATAH
ncbi:MAG TPA: xanthine dehydrogenase family protein molybdopterin-binding subunit [Chloroflexota bacterium]|nr:xanthine dehydrogenase family protein molybdopterin-binding subunit [Chloroflexota bacterium]